MLKCVSIEQESELPVAVKRGRGDRETIPIENKSAEKKASEEMKIPPPLTLSRVDCDS